ncbi:MAG TPA: penicillin-binding protein 2 [Chthoniobacterales bacterium]|jgi:penicillin-binding protein 2|nr:penicillin-binding protein 2 [Chthoniobacterales bacterium]
MCSRLIFGTCVALLWWISSAWAQEVAPANPTHMTPSWETQRQAATYALAIPGPRGQITDRNGVPLAQTRVSHNLSVVFPTPFDFTDRQVIDFVNRAAASAHGLTSRPIGFSDDAAVQHYRNRGAIPFDIASDLSDDEVAKAQGKMPPSLILRAIYVRTYPQGSLAGQVVGYTGRTSRESTRILQNNEPLWPESEGREGLEQTFDDQLRGKPGQLNLTFDKDGNKSGERIAVPPEPGYNLVTTLDVDMQRLAEKILQKRAKRGAIVVMDPSSGEVLALASWPTIDPNDFVPTISEEKFKKIASDPNIPMLPRAYRSAYPPGSTFKMFVGVAGFETHALDPTDEFDCPSALEIGNIVFRNWKKTDSGDLNFRQALAQSCNTWFYQAGQKIGSRALVTWAKRFGLGARTGILLNGEADGRIPTDEYMEQTYHRHILGGDLANLSIGQGDILISPLQMAQAMGGLANGGIVYQARIARQVQTLNNEVVYVYNPRAKDILKLSSVTMDELRKGMMDVVSSGTGGAAELKNVKVAGKTGTAQWGPKKKERTAAWFAGFAPADGSPKYAFAALYEGAPGEMAHGGAVAAPMIGELLRELFKGETSSKKAPQQDESDEMDEDSSRTQDQSN